MRPFRVLPTIGLGLVLPLAVSAQGASCPEAWLRFEPEVVELEGTITRVERFGPPNYGETPEVDVRLIVPILILEEEASVCGAPGAELNTEDAIGIREVQIVLPPGYEGSTPDELSGREVRVRGTLYRQVAGRHFTEVLIVPSSLRPVGGVFPFTPSPTTRARPRPHPSRCPDTAPGSPA